MLSGVNNTSEVLRENPGNTQYLVDKAKSGSEAAWRAILRRYRTMLVFHVRARIHGISRQDVDDMVQLVLAKVVRHIQAFQYRGEGSFRRWLATLVVNECQNELESRARKNTESCELTEVADAATARSQELADEYREVIEKMGELDEYDCDLLIMRYLEKKPWSAIAEILACSIEKAKGDYERAFRRLSRRLGA